MSTTHEESEKASIAATVATVSSLTKMKTSRNLHDNQHEHDSNTETKSCSVVEQLTENLQKISFGEPTDFSSNDETKISTTEELKEQLLDICNEVFRVLGPYNLEATYQRALTLELRGRGVTVLSEVEIPIEYKGKNIATRRIDLYLKLDKPVILELKAVVTGLKTEHLKQLKYYMTHFNVSEGYLINFPHITGFPDENNVQYVERTLQPEGAVGVSDRSTRSSTPRKDSAPTIVHVEQVKTVKMSIHTNKATFKVRRSSRRASKTQDADE